MPEEATETTEVVTETPESTETTETTETQTEVQSNGHDDDWRSSVKDEKLRDHAGKFTSVLDLVGKHYELRQNLSTAIQPLKGDATDEQVTDFRKKMGVPESVDGYEFSVPEGHETSDADIAFQTAAAELFHKNNISTEQAHGLSEWWNEMQAASLQAQVDGDNEFAAETLAALKVEWPGEEFTRNRAFADQAAVRIFGDDFDEVKSIETKDGKFVLDHPSFVKMLASYGREMQEGKLGNIMTESERGGVDREIEEMQTKIEKAKMNGDRSLANDLYQQEQELYRKAYGSGSVVGADGRVA